MLTDAEAFTSCSVDDATKARAFYADTLGLRVTDVPGMSGVLTLHLAGGVDVLLYEKADHRPASFTVLNFRVPDVDAAVDDLVRRGVTLQRYEGLGQDDRGVLRGYGPTIAWFTDPAGNVLSVLTPAG